MSSRSQVLSVYGRLLRLARTWQSPDPSLTAGERDYIRTETRAAFHRNKSLTDTADIVQRLEEAEARIAIARHYQNPYPRPVYTPPNTHVGLTQKGKSKFEEKLKLDATPIYMRSQRENQTKENNGQPCFQLSAVSRFQTAYAARLPTIHLPYSNLTSFIVSTADDHVVQEAHLVDIFDSAVERAHQPHITYKRKVVKALVRAVEEDGLDACDWLYDYAAGVINEATTKDKETDDHHRIITVDSQRLVVNESFTQLSHGTTGMSSWQASYALCEYLNAHRPPVGSSFVELGCGIGLTASVVCQSHKPSTYLCTDVNPNVISNCRANVERNVASNKLSTKVDYAELDFLNFIEADFSDPVDYVIASGKFLSHLCNLADICFDSALFPGLTSVLRHFVHNCKARALVMCTLRNQETYDSFISHISEDKSLQIVEHSFEWPEKRMFSYNIDESLPMICVEISMQI